jgi:integrase
VTIHRLKEKFLEHYTGTKGKHIDGGGLYLQVARPGQASWYFRHKEKWRSLGPAAVVTMAEARDKAHAMRRAIFEGVDPFSLLSSRAAKATEKTFAQAMEDYLAVKSTTWADSNKARELRRYEYLFGQIPDFVALQISAIDQAAKNKALATWPLGSKQHRDVGFYINAILKYAETGEIRMKHDAGAVEHHQSMPYAEVPAFFRRLDGVNSNLIDARALQFTILTGARTDEVIGGAAKAPATWAEITEVEGKPVWVIPGSRMKAGREHRVPLSAAALALLGARQADTAPLFEVSSQNGMLNTLKAVNGNGYTVHGFRTSFTEWVAHETEFSDDLADRCIAHEKRTKVRRAYQRGDLLPKRRPIMQSWSDYITSSAPATE